MICSVTFNLSEFLGPSADAPAHKYVASTAIGSSPCPDQRLRIWQFLNCRCCGYFLDLLREFEVKACESGISMSFGACLEWSDFGLSKFCPQEPDETKPQDETRPRLHDGQLLTVLILALVRKRSCSPSFSY